MLWGKGLHLPDGIVKGQDANKPGGGVPPYSEEGAMGGEHNGGVLILLKSIENPNDPKSPSSQLQPTSPQQKTWK